MAISGVSTAAPPPSSHQAAHALGHHKRGGHHSSSLTDIDVQGSSVATAPSSTGKVGSKLDVTA
ncbi:MAG: hypothetical protein WBF03_05535 [Xanthobacteraceae bacterium]|jgi:hypothetical protein